MSSDPEWRYINVRRLFNYISESIMLGTQWSVFEPNDQQLWIQLRIAASSFLTRTWREGALFGSSPDQAFFVKCDEETNPPDVIEAGQVVCQIGIAPVKPAEFVIFQLSQYADRGAEITA
jgi:phage tail sheath protein FI